MKKKMIRTACLFLAVIIMLCPLSVCFEANAAIESELIEDFIVDLILDTLVRWGISILEWGEENINQPVRQWLKNEIVSYLEDPLGTTFDHWISTWKWTTNNLGNFILNVPGLRDIYAFETYLIAKYNLVDNDTEIVSHGIPTINGYVVYNLPVTFRKFESGTYYYKYTYYSGGDQYIILSDEIVGTNQVGAKIYVISKVTGQCQVLYHYSNNDTSTSTLSISNHSGYSWKYYSRYLTDSINSSDHWDFTPYIIYPESEVQALLKGNYNIEESGSIVANTSVITDPGNDPNYIDGSCIIYFPDGTVGYAVIDWPESMSVDNLPAIVSTGSISNPGIQSVFLPIKSFITTFEDGFGLMTQLVYNLPSEIVGMALAIIGAIIIFGTIRIMKEH